MKVTEAHMEAQENKDILEKVKRGVREMIGLIKELTDTFSMSEWNVVWIDDEGKSHGKDFIGKQKPENFMTIYRIIKKIRKSELVIPCHNF